ncbi:MAG TPA: family 1 encapsulin nanocompartment shell protein, partial [Polyangiaceae bacterium]
MNLLKRQFAPVLPEAWEEIDEEASRVLKLNLAARKLVDFQGPFGWKFAAVNTGRLEPLASSAKAAKAATTGIAGVVTAALREVQPLVELKAPFTIPTAELDAITRGADDPDLDAVVKAAEAIARAEDDAIFNGNAAAKIAGIIPSSPHNPIPVADPSKWPWAVAKAKEALRGAGINGPYALALGPKSYDEVTAASEDGYPIRKRIEQIIDGPLVWAPAVSGAVLLSVRGGDYELTVGHDLGIGYTYHHRDSVELYISETFTFRILEEAAAIALKRG